MTEKGSLDIQIQSCTDAHTAAEFINLLDTREFTQNVTVCTHQNGNMSATHENVTALDPDTLCNKVKH